MSEKTQERDETQTDFTTTDRYLVDETPEMETSRQREWDHRPDAYTTGYDPYGFTRVGIGSTGGDIERLVRHNEGRHRSDGSHSAREAARDKKRITQSFCSNLEVTPFQQREALSVIGKLNLDRFGQQKRLEKVALAVIKVVVEWDRFDRLKHTNLADLSDDDIPQRVLEEEGFCKLLETYDVSRKDLYSVSQLVKRELKNQNHFRADTEMETDTDEQISE